MEKTTYDDDLQDAWQLQERNTTNDDLQSAWQQDEWSYDYSSQYSDSSQAQFTTTPVSSTDMVTTNASIISHHGLTVPEAETILLPEVAVVIFLMCCIVVVGLVRAKLRQDRDREKNLRKTTEMNSDDLAFYQHVYKTEYNPATLPAMCETQLPDEMPPVELHEITSGTSLLPTLNNYHVIPGYVEIVRVQISPRRSILPQTLRPTYSAPDTTYDNRPIETFGLCPRATSSSPAIMTGLWEHCRSEVARQIQTADLCPAHGDIHSSASETSALTGRTSPPAYRGESQGFDVPRLSSGSTIPRRITCRFCRERDIRTPPLSTPSASPKPHRKVVGTGVISRSNSPSSVIESGLRAIAEESGTLSSHRLCSLGPVRIHHLQDLNIIRSKKSNTTLSESVHASSQTEISIPLEEVEGSPRQSTRRQSCRPELQLGNFKALLLTPSSDDSRSVCSMTASISSSNFAAIIKEDNLDAVEVSSEPSSTPISSSQDPHKASSDRQPISDHAFGQTSSGYSAKPSYEQLDSGHLAKKISHQVGSDHSIVLTSSDHLASSSSQQIGNGRAIRQTNSDKVMQSSDEPIDSSHSIGQNSSDHPVYSIGQLAKRSGDYSHSDHSIGPTSGDLAYSTNKQFDNDLSISQTGSGQVPESPDQPFNSDHCIGQTSGNQLEQFPRKHVDSNHSIKQNNSGELTNSSSKQSDNIHFTDDPTDDLADAGQTWFRISDSDTEANQSQTQGSWHTNRPETALDRYNEQISSGHLGNHSSNRFSEHSIGSSHSAKSIKQFGNGHSISQTSSGQVAGSSDQSFNTISDCSIDQTNSSGQSTNSCSKQSGNDHLADDHTDDHLNADVEQPWVRIPLHLSTSDTEANPSHMQISSGHLASSSNHFSSDHSIDLPSGGQLTYSSSNQFGNGHSISHTSSGQVAGSSIQHIGDHSVGQTSGDHLEYSSRKNFDSSYSINKTSSGQSTTSSNKQFGNDPMDDHLNADDSQAWVRIPLHLSNSDTEANQSQMQQGSWHSSSSEMAVDQVQTLLVPSYCDDSDSESDSDDELTWLQK